MLTKEIIKSDAKLADLTDEQVAAITGLSKADEDVVIGKKTRDFWDDLDRDIKEVTGKDKPSGMKTYDFLKSTLTEMKTSSSSSNELKDKITALEAKKVELEKAIEEGKADPALKSKIKDLEKKVADNDQVITNLRNDIVEKEKDYQSKLESEVLKNEDYRFDSTFNKALVGVKFKDGLDKTVIDDVIARAKEKTKATGKREFTVDDQGNQTIIFRDENDIILTNKEDGQRPYTAQSVFLQNLAGIIDGGKNQPGGGGGNKKPEASSTIDLSGAKTKGEAVEAISQYLVANGIAAGSREFTEQQTKLYSENKVGELPTTV